MTEEQKNQHPEVEYSLTQCYTITFHEPDYERDKRLFHVILAHEKLLEAVCALEVLQASEDTYVEEQYGDMHYQIGNVLQRFIGYFSKEDQEYIRRWGNDYDSFSSLGDCFRSKPSGFYVSKHEHEHSN